MKPGDIVTADSGQKYQLGECIAVVGGGDSCKSPRCRRNMLTGECMGYHCPRCGEPTGMMGHECPKAEAG